MKMPTVNSFVYWDVIQSGVKNGEGGRCKPEDFKLPVKLAQLEADLMMPISIN